jgi:hypothetical protein
MIYLSFSRQMKQIDHLGNKNEMLKKTKRFIHVGDLAAEVPIDLLYDDCGWSPTISSDDVRKLDRVREALGKGDIGAALNDAKVFQLVPVRL